MMQTHHFSWRILVPRVLTLDVPACPPCGKGRSFGSATFRSGLILKRNHGEKQM